MKTKERKKYIRLSNIEKKILQEAYRLSCFRTLELRLALSPILPNLEPSKKEMSGKKNRNTALKWRQQVHKRIWSQGNEQKISGKTYDNILAPGPIQIESGNWGNIIEPAHLCYNPCWMIVLKHPADPSRRGLKVYNFEVIYRDSIEGRVKCVNKENYSPKKIEDYINNLIADIAKKNNVTPGAILHPSAKGDADKIFIGKRCTNPPESFSKAIAVHAVQIQYKQKESNEWILILFDRPSCYVKLKHFPDFSSEKLVSEIKNFHDKLKEKAWVDIDSRSLRFVTDASGCKSSALSLTKEDLTNLLKKNGISTDNLAFDPPVTFEKEEILTAGDLKKIKKLQERLVKYQNKFNLGFKKEYTRPLNLIYENYLKKREESGQDASDVLTKTKVRYGLRAWSKPKKYVLEYRTVSKNNPNPIKG